MRSDLPYAWPLSMPASTSRCQICGQLLDAGAEQVDPLTAGDLRVEAEVLRDLADDDEVLGRHLAAGDARDDGVGAVLLQVGEHVVVGVLQRAAARRRGRSRRQSWRRIEAAVGLQMSQPRPRPCSASSCDQVRMPLHPDDLEHLRAAEVEVLAQRVADGDARARRARSVTSVLHQADAGAADRAGAGARLDAGDVAAAAVADRAADLRPCVTSHAGADLRLGRQRADAEAGTRRLAGRQDEVGRVAGQLAADHAAAAGRTPRRRRPGPRRAASSRRRRRPASCRRRRAGRPRPARARRASSRARRRSWRRRCRAA